MHPLNRAHQRVQIYEPIIVDYKKENADKSAIVLADTQGTESH